MRRRLLAALLALMLALGGACLADGEDEAPAEPAAEQSAPAPEPKTEPKSEPAPAPEPKSEPETKSEPEPKQESEPAPEPSNDDGNGGESEEDVSDDDAPGNDTPENDTPEGEVPPASNSEENPDGGGDEIIEDEASGDETSEDEVSEDEISEVALDENPEDEGDEGGGEDVEASLTVGIEGMESTDGVWHIPAGTASIRFTWNPVDGASEYAWSVEGSGKSGTTAECAVALDVSEYAPGTYMFTVSAAGATGSAKFVIEDSGEQPGPDEPEPAGGLTIAAEDATQREDGTWEFPAGAETLRFTWAAVEGAVGYSWSIDGTEPQDNQTSTELVLSAQDYAQGSHTLTVTASFDDGSEPLTATLTFALAQAQRPDERPGDRPGGGRPGGFGGFGGRPSGGSRPSGGGAGGGLPEEEQGFRVTPGEALTDAHISGTKDMTAYGAANLSLTEEPVAWLALSGDAPDVRRADGSSFTATLEEDALALSCEDAAAEWIVNPLALAALRQSGVAALRLGFGAESVELPTDLELTGAVYASYRMRGYVSKDFELHVSLRGIAAVVDGESYALNEAHELIQV